MSRVGDGGEDAPPTAPPQRAAAARAVAAPELTAPASPVSSNGAATAVLATPLARRVAAGARASRSSALRGQRPAGPHHPGRRARRRRRRRAARARPPRRRARRAPPPPRRRADPARGDVDDPAAVPRAAAHRPPDGRVGEHRAALPGADGGRHGRGDRAARRAEGAGGRRRRRAVASTTSSSRPARWPCATHPRANGSYRDGRLRAARAGERRRARSPPTTR